MSPTTRSHWFLLCVSCTSAVALIGTNLHCSSGTTPAVARRPAFVTASATALPFAGKVSLGGEAGSSAREAAEALAKNLSRATGSPFALGPAGEQGIHLQLASSPEAPADLVAALRDLGPEAYALRARGDGQAWIVANDDRGLVYGAYRLLERLGFRFFFPNERWTVTPKPFSAELRVEEVVRPAFRKRRFAGTGGFGRNPAVDPQGQLAARWRTWMLQNGFGEEFHTAGHAGEAFNVRNREELLRHPEYLASVKGKRAPWSKSAKLDPSNPDAVALFVRDRLQSYREQLERHPSGSNSFAVSVEPSDGGGHCDSPACARIGGPSEQQFFLANAVARELASRYPGAHASIYAYNKHADIPELEIEPNVYVTLIPYAFRGNSSEPPEAFVEAWSRKKSPLSLYDYWAIPDWTADLPEFDFRSTPAKKLRFWKAHQVEGVVCESTYGAGPMGLAWYIAGHLMWDLALDPEALAADFFEKAFSDAAPPMRRMLERWASGFMLTRAELHSSFADLAEALGRSPTREVTARLADYAVYVQYLRLRHEYLEAEPEQEAARKRELLLLLWRAYDSAMLHTSRLHKLLLRGDADLAAALDPRRADLPIWKELRAPSVDEAMVMVSRGIRDFPRQDVGLKLFDGDLIACSGDADDATPEPGGGALTLVGANRLELTTPIGLRELRVELTSVMELRARLLGPGLEELSEIEVPAGDAPTVFAAELPKPGTYWLDLRAPKRSTVTVKAPPGVGVELQEFRIPASAPVDLFFCVPRSEKRVAIYSRSRIQPAAKRGFQLVDGAGRVVPAELGDAGHLLTAVVPPGQDGKVWTLKRAVAPNTALRLLNAPQRFALSRRALRVPAGALGERAPGAASASGRSR
jgi:Domain of unknown function (DUF4838)/Glycosyl hydrolase family 20, domain 2